MSDQLLRRFVRATISESEEEPETFEVRQPDEEHKLKGVGAAGIVVVRMFEKGYKVLGLLQGDEFDLPKGKIEKGETHIEAALRETEEESSVTDLTFRWGREHIVLNERLVMYVASTEQEGEVARNPESGNYEHDDVEWITFDEAIDSCKGFLVPALHWARMKVEKLDN